MESDTATKARHRADYARILVRMHHPLLQCFTMAVDVDGTSCIILVEKDDVSFDYGTIYGMPSTPWKVYNSEVDGASEDDDHSDDVNKCLTPKIDAVFPSPNDKDYESAVDVETDEEDEVYRDDRMEGLQVLKPVSPAKMEKAVPEANDDGGLEALPEAAEVQVESPGENLTGAVFLHSKFNVSKEAINSEKDEKEQLQDLYESGYTLEEIEGWRKNVIADGIKIKGKQILNNEFQNFVFNCDNRFSVTGYSFNSQDFFLNYCWPHHTANWDPRISFQPQGIRSCLPHGFSNQNQFLSLTSPSLASQGNNDVAVDVFVRTSPNQIVRQQAPSILASPVVRENNSPHTPQTSALPLTCVEVIDPVSTVVVVSPNTNSSKKSSQRGRPKGSKNKPQSLPEDYLEPVPGEDGVTTRAQRVWLLGKQLGLKPRGSEALMLRGLEAQIRENHPHLK